MASQGHNELNTGFADKSLDLRLHVSKSQLKLFSFWHLRNFDTSFMQSNQRHEILNQSVASSEDVQNSFCAHSRDFPNDPTLPCLWTF